MKMNNRKVLVVRNVLSTVRDSVFAEFKRVLRDWGLLQYCKVTEAYLTIKFPNGSEILFKGLDDEEKIKSIEGITDCIVEEATEIDKEKYDQLHIRMRNRKAGYNQMILMYNPIGRDNWVYGTFHAPEAKETLKNTIICHTTYKHNKWLPQSNIDFIENMKHTNYRKWLIYAMGEFASLGKTIYDNYEEFEFDEQALRQAGIPCYFGLDYGYTNDPSAFIKVYVDNDTMTMYIADEMYEKGLVNKDIARWIVARGYSKDVITADSSEPKSNEELRRMGLRRVKGARKGKDSIMHGIQFIQNYRVIVSPKCTNTLLELQNYTWKKDKLTGQYVNVPEDKYNHLMDAWRYAIESIMPKGRIKTLDKSRFGF